MSKVGQKKLKFTAVSVFAFTVTFEKWTFYVTDLPRTGKKRAEAREGCAWLLFLLIKYAKFAGLTIFCKRYLTISFLQQQNC